MSSPLARLLQTRPADLQVMRERARELARKPSADLSGTVIEVLEINSRSQRFAIPLQNVEGVAEVSSVACVPRCPGFVRGLVSFRGEVLVCVELSSLVAASDQGFADLRRIVSLAADGRKLALLAEKDMVVRPTLLESFKPSSLGSSGFLVGTDETFLSLLDPSALIAHSFRMLSEKAP